MATDLSQTIQQILSSHDLDYLHQHYNQHGLTTPFVDAKNDYVGHLLATIAAKHVELTPPLHVDVLWHGHLLETKRWRAFEKLVIEKYKESGGTTDMDHIDYSLVNKMPGQDERLQVTRNFYELLGLQYNNDVDNHHINEDLDNIGQVHLIHDSPLSGRKRERSEDMFRVHVRDPVGNLMQFIVGKNTKVSEFLTAYAQKKRIKLQDVRFLFDGDNINDSEDTIEELGVTDQDLIHAQFEKYKYEEMFMVKVQDPQGNMIHFTVKRQTKASKIIGAYARTKGIHPNFVRLRFNGNYIDENTMGDLGVEHLDELHVVLENH